MEKEDIIVNKVDQSGLEQFDLERLKVRGERVLFDLKNWLYEELILKEKDFREKLKAHDWTQYKGKLVAVTCTADAIVPTWAYMLVATELQPYAQKIIFGDLNKLEEELYRDKISALNPEEYRNQKMIIKGCGDVPVSAFVELTNFLRPLTKSIMYGEPCSTVPVYKAKGSAVSE